MAPYHEPLSSNAGLMEEISAAAFERLFASRFGESITLTVDEDGCVHAISVSRPRTTLFDQGKNRENILSLWQKLDEYLLPQPGAVTHHNVNIGNIGNIGNVGNIGNNSGIVQNSSVGDVSQTNDLGSHGPHSASSDEPSRRPGENDRWDVGVITILSEETQAVLLALDLRRRRIGGLHFYEGEVRSHEGREGREGHGHEGREERGRREEREKREGKAYSNERADSVKVVATRALEQGNRSVMAAYENLRRHYDPKVFALVGIGGGIHPDLATGDVVVATRIVYYDLRKKTPSGTRHRGEERSAPAEIGHAVNAFFTDHEPASFPVEDPAGIEHDMRMWSGLIGSGDAVIADRDDGILSYLASFNDKILAVDMEAGGLSAACHEQSAASGQLQGWVVIRGISDDAGAGKNDDHHRLASWHAAVALEKLLPYLTPRPS